MKTWKSRPILAVIGVLLLAFVGCSGDSPTEPSKPGSGTPTPPTDSVTVTVTVSGVTPSSAIVTATVDGGNAPDGTAVEFETGLGTFAESGTGYALRSTTGGKASVTVLAAGTEKSTVVRVRVRSTIVDREVKYVTDQIPEGSPTISSITPATGSPTGGYVVSIVGRNFFEPVRVFFGDKEAVVASYTAETSTTSAVVKAVVPAINLNVSEQARAVAVTVIARAGTTGEASGSLNEGFRYELDILTPEIRAVTPSSGPIEGNTRITIFGDGFQSPLVAYFGSGNTRVDLELVSISYSQIIAVTPPAAGLGSEFANTSVPLTVHNIASNKTATLNNAFRYGPELQITTVTPISGSYLGGTRVTISGFGFDEPVQALIGGLEAQVIRVSGTEIIAITNPPVIRDCQVSGATSPSVIVTNLEDGQFDVWGDAPNEPGYTYIFDPPTIISFTPTPVTENNQFSVTVRNPGFGNVAIGIGDIEAGEGVTATPNPPFAPNPLGETTFTISVPTGLTFDTEACLTTGGAPGLRNVATEFPVVFLNLENGCVVEALSDVTVVPLDTTCAAGPVGRLTPDPVAFGSRAEGAGPYTITVNVTNIGSDDLVVSTITLSGDAAFTRGAITNPVVGAGLTETFDVIFTPPVVGASTDYTATLAVSTNGGVLTVDVTGTGTP